MMKQAIIVTENSYPEGDAGAIRQHAFAKLLSEVGYDVLVIGYGEPTDGDICVYDGIKYISFRENNASPWKRVWNRMLFGKNVYKFILSKYSALDVLFVVDLMPDAFRKMALLKKKYGCVLIHDSVEWYSPEEFKNGKYNLAYRRKEYTNVKAIDAKWNVIAISEYLRSYFQGRANRVVRIPVIMDINNLDYRVEVNECERIVFSYAGGPGKKDFLKEIIDGFVLLGESKRNCFELNIIGVDREQLINLCGVDETAIDALGSSLKIHGRVTRNIAINKIKESDYSLLIRDERLRYAQAGFPTKIVESLACGTPPLCNYSSDLSMYLVDKRNSVIVNGHTARDVCEAVSRALNISDKSERMQMRKNARDLALACFNYTVYKDLIIKICEIE
ncbi:MAG: glycosyltransferase [Lachnospiraceae bacterium]|nr:glycosyltransferase [Lachnospiraceae bacterium]